MARCQPSRGKALTGTMAVANVIGNRRGSRSPQERVVSSTPLRILRHGMEYYVFNMLAYKNVCHVRSFEPRWLAWHVIRDHSAVDSEIFKDDVLDFTPVVVACDDRGIRVGTVIGDIFENHILDSSAR